MRARDLANFDPRFRQRTPSEFAILWHVDRIQGDVCPKQRDTSGIGQRFISKCRKPVHIFGAMEKCRYGSSVGSKDTICVLTNTADHRVQAFCDILSQIFTTLWTEDHAAQMPAE